MMTPQEIDKVNSLYQRLDAAEQTNEMLQDERVELKSQIQVLTQEVTAMEQVISSLKNRLVTERQLLDLIEQIQSVTVKAKTTRAKRK